MNTKELQIACIRKGTTIKAMLIDLNINRGKYYRHVKKGDMPVDMVKKISSYLDLTIEQQQVIFFWLRCNKNVT